MARPLLSSSSPGAALLASLLLTTSSILSVAAPASAQQPPAGDDGDNGAPDATDPDATDDGPPDDGPPDDGPPDDGTDTDPDESGHAPGDGAGGDSGAGVSKDDPGSGPMGLESPHHLVVRSALAFSLNPLGLASVSSIDYQYELFPNAESVLLQDTFASVGLRPYVTPAFARVGPRVGFKPLAILQLGVLYETIAWFGTFNHFQSFNSPTAEHDDDTIVERGDAGLNYTPLGGTQLTLDGLLQAKVGPIAARSRAQLMFTDMEVRGGDTVFYDPVNDMALPARGSALSIDSDLLYLAEGGLTAGLRHTYIAAFYKKSDFQPGESTKDPNGPVHRLGPLVAWKLPGDWGTTFQQPSVFSLTQWYLAHRYRAGQETSQLVPYFVIGISFEGDLLSE